MIVVVCLNPALDITHHVPKVDWSGVNRPAAVYTRPGGKGTNVARALHSFGLHVLLMGLAGGTTGGAVEAGLRQLAVPAAFTATAGETRRTFTVVDGEGRAALFNEPGPEVSAAEFARFRLAYGQAMAGAAAVVLSGSLPRGLPSTAYAELIAVAADAGVPAVLDTSGDALRAGVAAGPAIVKPNLDELRALSGRSLSTAGGGIAWAAVAAAAAGLRSAGARAVVVSLGPAGLLAVTGDGCWQARPVRRGARERDRRGRRGDRRAGARAGPRPLVGRPAAARGRPGRRERRGAGGRRVQPGRLRGRAGRRGGTAGGLLMPVAMMSEVIESARAAGGGVCAFNVVSIEHAEAIVAGAEAAGAPVVLQISENCVAYHGALAPIARACLAIAGQATVPVPVHLDHVSSVELVEAAAGLGLASVMYDASRLSYAGNVRATAQVARWCHERGIWVEAELGEIGGKDGVHSPAARTDPGEAARFVVGYRGRRAGGRGRQLARYADPRCCPGPWPHRRDRPRGQRPSRPARLVRCPRPGPGRGGPGRDDQGQHRDPAEQGIHRRRPAYLVRRAGDG